MLCVTFVIVLPWGKQHVAFLLIPMKYVYIILSPYPGTWFSRSPSYNKRYTKEWGRRQTVYLLNALDRKLNLRESWHSATIVWRKRLRATRESSYYLERLDSAWLPRWLHSDGFASLRRSVQPGSRTVRTLSMARDCADLFLWYIIDVSQIWDIWEQYFSIVDEAVLATSNLYNANEIAKSNTARKT